MQKNKYSARRGPFVSREGQLRIIRHQTLWFVLASATLSHRPWTFQIHSSEMHMIRCLFCQHIIFRGCYARCSHLHSFLLWKWSTEDPFKFRFHCPRLTIRAAFILFRPMYLVAVLSQNQFHIFEFQCFFA